MNIEQAVLNNLKILPLEQQREALAFIEALARRRQPGRSFRTVRGTHRMNLDDFERDLAEVRREMWQSFPRQDPK